jgi:tetratricopeptide (TPR) repeat protein
MDTNHLAIIIRTFTSLYPNTVVFHPQRSGEIILVGFEDDHDRINTNLIVDRAASFSNRLLLPRAGVDTSQDLLDAVVATGQSLKTFCIAQESINHDARINTDNNLITEYLLPAHLATAHGTIEGNLYEIERVTPAALSKRQAGPYDQAESVYRQACWRLSAGQTELALSQALHLPAPCAKCQKLAGVALFKLGRYKNAAEQFRRSLAINANQFAVRMLLGETLLGLDQASAGLDEFNLAGLCQPERHEPYEAAVAYYTLSGKPTEARETLAKLEKRQPGSVTAACAESVLGHEPQSRSEPAPPSGRQSLPADPRAYLVGVLHRTEL